MASIICPACSGEGVRTYQPYATPSPYDQTVKCDLCGDNGLPGAVRRVPSWKANYWRKHPTQPRKPLKPIRLETP